MSRQSKFLRMSEEEYLRNEESAKERSEFVDGYVFTMTGATEAHNSICMNLSSLIHMALRNGPCRAFANDMKVRIKSRNTYYYPDIMVTCEPYEAKSVFKNAPVLIIEVLSPSTSQIDRREKLMAYQKIESLKEYIVVYQDRKRLEVYRKDVDENWVVSTLTGDETVTLESIPNELSISLSEIYERCNPPHRVKEEEAEYSFSNAD